MGLGIYKPNQGYWVRMLSAVGFGLLVLAGSMWLWSRLENIGRTGTVQRNVTEVTSRLVAWGRATNQKDIQSLQGLARIKVQDTQDGRKVHLVDNQGQQFTLSATSFDQALAFEAPGLPALGPSTRVNIALIKGAEVAKEVVNFSGVPSWAYTNKVYIQSGVTVTVLLTCAGLLFWVFNKPRIVDFLIATEAEMRKVNWPTKREVSGSTWIVICGIFMMAILILIIDMAFSELFINLRVLEGTSVIRKWFF